MTEKTYDQIVDEIQRDTFNTNKDLIDKFNSQPFWKKWGKKDDLKHEIIRNWSSARLSRSDIQEGL